MRPAHSRPLILALLALLLFPASAVRARPPAPAAVAPTSPGGVVRAQGESPGATLAAPRDVVINEVGWSGTAAGSADEWIELYNNTAGAIDLAGWTLRAADGSPAITLTGSIPAQGYYLLERTDDSTISDIPADWIGSFGFGLGNAGESLTLRDAASNIVDTANGDGGAWPAGTASPNYQSMERVDPLAADGDANWASNDMVTRNGLDANGNPVNGTPKALNSASLPPAQDADLVAAKAGPTTVVPAGPITYTLTISSAGMLDASAVRVTDTLPAGVAFSGQSSPYPYSHTLGTVVWTVGDLPSGTQALLILYGAVLPTATGTLTNVVIASTTASETDLLDNTATWRTTVYLPGEGAVVINEVAWMGTAADYNDEWIELYNAGSSDVDLAGWTIRADDGTPEITLTGVITAGGYYLLERSDDGVITDVVANQTYTGALGNDPNGEVLRLRDAGGSEVDTANVENGGSWPAGDNGTKSTMERIASTLPDTDANWATNDMIHRNGHDRAGGPINGTPKALNSASLPPLPAADLVLAKSGPPAVSPGEPIAYVLTIANSGNTTATAVLISDTLPAGVVFSSQTGPFTFTQAGRLLRWEAGSLAPAAQGTLLVTGTVALTAVGTLRNEVYATTAVTEVTTTNNLAWVDTLVAAHAPDVAVAKTGPATVNAGGAIHYLLAVQNLGDQDAPDVVVTDTLPAGILFAASSYTSTQYGSRVVWALGPLGAGGAVSITLDGQVAPTATGTVTNALAAATSAAEPNLGNNTASWPTTILPPNAGRVIVNEVAWAGTAASTSDEWLELYNTSSGDVDLTGWNLSDGGDISITLVGTIAAGGYYLLERTADDTVSDIPADQIYSGGLGNAGESLTLRDAGGSIVDTANGNGGEWPAGLVADYRSMERIDPAMPDADANWLANDMVHRNGLDAAGAPINGTPRNRNAPLQMADLSVAKSGPPEVTVGMAITYTLAISNAGGEAAPEVRVTDTLPAGVAFVSSTPPPSEQQGQDVVWSLGTLYTGSLVLITVRGQVGAGAPIQLYNTLAAVTTAPEIRQANNTATWHTVVQGGLVRQFLPLLTKGAVETLRIDAVFYDGYMDNDPDEAIQVRNAGTTWVNLAGWEFCKQYDADLDLECRSGPALAVAPGGTAWLARNAVSFTVSFGFAPAGEMVPWIYGGQLSNGGDEVVLRDPRGRVADAVVYGTGNYTVPGWVGPAVVPYYDKNQILHRRLDEQTGRPVADTDTAADWMQDAVDPWHGRRALHPGWDMSFFQPLSVTEAASLTVAVTPDNGAEVLLAAVGRAQERIEIEIYTLELAGLVQALVDKAQAGVSVTVLLEGGPVGGLSDQERWACQQIEGSGGACWFMFHDPNAITATVPVNNRYDYLHAKLVLIDRQWAVISSQNATPSGMPDDDKGDGTWGSRGVLVLTNAPSVVARTAAMWDADMDPTYGDLTRWAPDHPYGYDAPPDGFLPITVTGGTTYTVQFTPWVGAGALGLEVLTSPESSLRVSDGLLGLVARAGPGDEVYVEQAYEYSVWEESVLPGPNLRLESYIAAAQRGARVRLLLNGQAFSRDPAEFDEARATVSYVNDLAFCNGWDLQVRLGNPTGYGIHNKMVLARVGGQGYAHIGSINGSESSSKLNRELAVQIRSTEVYNYLAGVFAWDWAQTSSLLISEVVYDSVDDFDVGEWVEIYNPTAAAVSLDGWELGDAVVWGEYASGRYRFPTGTMVAPFGLLVVAARAGEFRNLYGFAPDFEFRTGPDDPQVPNMVVYASWEGFGFALGNGGDEVALWNAAGEVEDLVLYCGDTVPCAVSYPGARPYPGAVEEHGSSLERFPAEMDTDYCDVDFQDTVLPTPGQFPAGYHGCGER